MREPRTEDLRTERDEVAERECHVLLIERKSTLHTGDVVTDKTRSISEQLRPV